jgi:MYXO-CTERM domain-containing protein
MKTDPSKKVAKELLLDMEARTKDGEYITTIVGDAEEIKSWLSQKNYTLPAGADQSFSDYEAAGYKFLALNVDPNRVELVGGDRAQLSPIRVWTNQEIKSIPMRFGLPSAAKEQEILLYTLVPEQRMQVTNYETQAVPTNLRVVTDYVESADKQYNLKEKVGEFFVALHDRYLEKHPNTFLLEYAWPSDDCGQPCANEPLLPDELLTLGGDVFEADLPEEVRRPEPPPMTDEEKTKLEAVMAEKETPKEKAEAKKMFEEERQELVARRGILARNKYVLSRLHYRYNAAQMPKDVELGAGAPITGGVGLPLGEQGAADTTVKPSDKNQFQSRYNGLFPNKVVVNCDNPKHHRWGKAPRSYRGLRKIWVAEDLARRNRKRIDIEEAIITPVPDLGVSGAKTAEQKAAEKKAADEAAATAATQEKEGDCGCRAAGKPGGGGWKLLAVLLALFGLRRFAQRRPALGQGGQS